MGSYTPLPWAPDDLAEEVTRTVLQPTIDEMAQRGTPFSGLLYAGLALTSNGVRWLNSTPASAIQRRSRCSRGSPRRSVKCCIQLPPVILLRILNWSGAVALPWPSCLLPRVIPGRRSPVD
jgi:hypothetical protein